MAVFDAVDKKNPSGVDLILLVHEPVEPTISIKLLLWTAHTSKPWSNTFAFPLERSLPTRVCMFNAVES